MYKRMQDHAPLGCVLVPGVRVGYMMWGSAGCGARPHGWVKASPVRSLQKPFYIHVCVALPLPGSLLATSTALGIDFLIF